MNTPRVIVLSTGRAGTTLLSRILTHATGITVPHQTPGSRAANILGNLSQAGRLPIAVTRATLRAGWRMDPWTSTADPLRSMWCGQEIERAGAPSDLRIIHLVRDARDFVASFMAWKRQSLKRSFLHHVVPAWQPNPWLAREAGLVQWVRMSKFEHFCWIWRFKNEWFAGLARHGNYLLVRTEDLVGPNTYAETANALARFVTGQPPLKPPTPPAQVHASRESYPRWPEWTPAMAGTLARHCGPLMGRFGYGREPAWQELVGQAARSSATVEVA